MVDSTGPELDSKSPGANILAVEMRRDHSANIRRASKLAQHPEGWLISSFWMYLESRNANCSKLFRPSAGLSCHFMVFTCSHVCGVAFFRVKRHDSRVTCYSSRSCCCIFWLCSQWPHYISCMLVHCIV